MGLIPLEDMKHFIFSFPNGNEVLHGVDSRYSTRNVSVIRRRVGDGSVLMGQSVLTIDSKVPSAYFPAYGIQREVRKNI